MFDLKKYTVFVDLAVAVVLGLVAFFGLHSEIITTAVLMAFIYVHFPSLKVTAEVVIEKIKEKL